MDIYPMQRNLTFIKENLTKKHEIATAQTLCIVQEMLLTMGVEEFTKMTISEICDMVRDPYDQRLVAEVEAGT